MQLLNSEKNGKIYLFKSIITLFPVSVSLDGRDEHGLKLEKVGQTFSMVLILLAKITKNVMVSALSDKRCFYIFFITLLSWVPRLFHLTYFGNGPVADSAS